MHFISILTCLVLLNQNETCSEVYFTNQDVNVEKYLFKKIVILIEKIPFETCQCGGRGRRLSKFEMEAGTNQEACLQSAFCNHLVHPQLSGGLECGRVTC